ncbi:MAG TPA: discoidin domain-containing protein [Longimicrobiaceae bacterium]
MARYQVFLLAAMTGLAGCVGGGTAPAPVADATPVIPPINGGRAIAEITDTISPVAPIVPVSVAEEQRRFVLQPGYRIEPVLTEPDILEPAAIAFDGNGRMFVLELRTYMQDADATGELEPGNRISMHDDTDNDGVYDRHTVFVDGLVFPRFVMPFGKNSILTMESNEDEVYRFTDTDGDGSADRKELFTTSFGRSGNVEHQQAFLYWGMDNWMYSTYNAFRIRWTPNGVIREPTGPNGSQWGVTQDNEGKIWFQGGASGLPSQFQFPVHYGRFRVEDQLQEGFDEPFGLAGVGDYQPGPTASRPDGTLARVTGSAGNDVFRGNRLPADLVGDYLYGEPVARIIRRVRPVVREGLTQLQNPYQGEKSEFIRSIDPLFRPVDLATAPDGTLYIVDMYRGIIQEGNWTRPGTHLRNKIEQYGMDSVTSRGRIWRVTYEGMERDRRRPRMLDESPAQLVRHLEDANGWWRDMAQQLLILAQDRSVVPALRTMARSSTTHLGRYHALWTLEGLDALDSALARELLRDQDPRVRIQAIRASETLYKQGDQSFAADFRALARDANADVALQAMLTMNVLKVPELESSIQAAMTANPARGVQEIGTQILEQAAAEAAGGPFAGPQFSDADRALLARGATIYGELCSQCHGETGRGTPAGEGQTIAPALAGSPRVQGHREYVIKTLLHGMTGPIEGTSYPGGMMLPMGENDDQWVAAVASYIRKALGNDASMVSAGDVARVRAADASRSTPWTYEQLVASVPSPIASDEGWRVTASHNADGAQGALNFAGWSTQAPQAAGMWFQIELPQPTTLTEIQFDSPMQRIRTGPPGAGGGPGAGGPPAFQSTAPAAYRVEVSADGTTWTPVAEGTSSSSSTVISFAPTRGRFVRITQTDESGAAPSWSMMKLRLFEKAEGR